MKKSLILNACDRSSVFFFAPNLKSLYMKGRLGGILHAVMTNTILYLGRPFFFFSSAEGDKKAELGDETKRNLSEPWRG